MKKTIATLLALSMVFAVALTAAFAEDPAGPTFTNGIRFNMDLDKVIELMNRNPYEIDTENTRGAVVFQELEYENVREDGDGGFTADIKYLFVGNGLAAIHYDFEDGTSYEAVKARLTGVYGEAVPFSAAKIGNGKYAVDDDGELKHCKEMIEANGLIIVLEQDKDGDVDVTMLDPTAAYINN
jgi:hypothetical protein